MQHEINIVAKALEENFKKQVELTAEMPFADTKVSLPHKSIWISYAKAAVEALNAST